MNELEVLESWHPAGPDVPDHEAVARAALQAVIAGRPPSSRRRLAGRALIAAAVTTALVAGGVAVATRVVDDGLDGVKRVHVGALDAPAPGAPVNVLVLGNDSRAFVQDAQQASQFGTPAGEGGTRSDTMILVRVAGDSVTAVWLPRDLLVTDAAGNRTQLSSFADEGPRAAVAAVRNLTGEPIDHYVEIDMAGFVKVVDALGGVRMWVRAPVRDTYSGLDIARAGCTTFDGDRALAWARSRHAEYFENGRWVNGSPRADLDRITRQQDLLRAIGVQSRARIGTDVAEANDVLDTVARSLTVDAAMDRDTLRSFVGDLVRPARFVAVTAPNEPDPEQPGRLRLLARPAGEDFVTWATPRVPTATASPASAGAVPPPAYGASC